MILNALFPGCALTSTPADTASGTTSGTVHLYTCTPVHLYYFRVQNMRADTDYRFSFVNLSKPDSQYSVGMKPVLFSEVEAKETGTGWTRVGTEMTYFKDVKASEASLSVAVSQLMARNMIIWLLFRIQTNRLSTSCPSPCGSRTRATPATWRTATPTGTPTWWRTSPTSGPTP